MLRTVAIGAACAGLVLAAGLAPAQQEPEALRALRGIYERSLKVIRDEAAQARAALPARYGSELADLKARRQQAGDFDGVMAVQKEAERLGREKSLPRADAGGATHPELAALQKTIREAAEAVDLNESRRIVDLAAKYTARLDAAVKENTVAGKLADAQAYAAESKRVMAGAEVTAAQFRVAAADALAAPPAPPEGGATSSPPTGGATPAAAPPGPPPVTDARFQVYVDQRPPSPAGVVLKRTSLRNTALCGVGAQASVSAMLGSKSRMEKDSSHGIYSRSSYSSGAIDYYLRLEVRARTTAQTYDNVTVMAQYFSRSSSKGAGKISPEQARVEKLRLPKLSAGTTTIDFPTLSLSQYESRYSSAYSSSSYGGGRELYGVLVSVFDSAGTLLYQGVSNPSLDDFGRTAAEALNGGGN